MSFFFPCAFAFSEVNHRTSPIWISWKTPNDWRCTASISTPLRIRKTSKFKSESRRTAFWFIETKSESIVSPGRKCWNCRTKRKFSSSNFGRVMFVFFSPLVSKILSLFSSFCSSIVTKTPSDSNCRVIERRKRCGKSPLNITPFFDFVGRKRRANIRCFLVLTRPFVTRARTRTTKLDKFFSIGRIRISNVRWANGRAGIYIRRNLDKSSCRKWTKSKRRRSTPIRRFSRPFASPRISIRTSRATRCSTRSKICNWK